MCEFSFESRFAIFSHTFRRPCPPGQPLGVLVRERVAGLVAAAVDARDPPAAHVRRGARPSHPGNRAHHHLRGPRGRRAQAPRGPGRRRGVPQTGQDQRGSGDQNDAVGGGDVGGSDDADAEMIPMLIPQAGQDQCGCGDAVVAVKLMMLS